MRTRLLPVKAGLFTLFIALMSMQVAPVVAQDPSSSEIAALLDDIAEAIAFERTEPEQATPAYETLRPHLLELAALVPSLDLYVLLADVEMSGTEAMRELEAAIAEIEASGGVADASTVNSVINHLVAALEANGQTSVERPSDLAALAEVLDRIADLGADIGVPGSELLKSGSKLAKLGLSASELANRDAEAVGAFAKELIGYLPPGLAPSLSGPAAIAFHDKLEWDAKMYDASTEGLDIVADAMESGQFDAERYAALSDEIETLAAEGPWGSDSASEFLKSLAAEIPVVGSLIEAMWPGTEEGGGVCGAISCDCDNLNFGLLTGPYREECRAAEESLKQACRASGGQIEGSCHITASGPNPHIPQP